MRRSEVWCGVGLGKYKTVDDVDVVHTTTLLQNLQQKSRYLNKMMTIK